MNTIAIILAFIDAAANAIWRITVFIAALEIVIGGWEQRKR